MLLLLVRYLAGIISFGITFAGAWLYEFTTTDEQTKERRLTPWGKRALKWTILSLIISVVLTVWTDWAARKKEKADEDKAHIRDAQIAEYQQKSEQRQEDVVKLLNLLNNNQRGLSASSQEDVRNTVQSLSGISDYKNQYPDLYSKLTSAESLDQVKDVLAEGIKRNLAQRISTDTRCAGLPIHSDTPDNPMKFGHILLEKPGRQKGSVASLSLVVSGEGVQFEVTDVSGSTDLSHGYSLQFADGSSSSKLTCLRSTDFSCTADTFGSTQAMTLYKLVQRNLVSKVLTGKGSIDVDSASAKELTRTFSCIEP